MPQLPSLPDKAHLSDLFTRFPKGGEPLMVHTDAVLRGPCQFLCGHGAKVATLAAKGG